MADVFDALGAPVRRAILDVLSARDHQTLFEIVHGLLVDHDLDLVARRDDPVADLIPHL
jgi:DNA-binding transcriptional ArsR family regulator